MHSIILVCSVHALLVGYIQNYWTKLHMHGSALTWRPCVCSLPGQDRTALQRQLTAWMQARNRHRAHSKGMWVICYPCGIAIASQPYHVSGAASQLQDWLKKLSTQQGLTCQTCVIVYDNACTIAKSIRPGAPQHVRYQQLTQSMWIVDRFHFSGHSAGDEVCRT
jgi:hypothetical protein